MRDSFETYVTQVLVPNMQARRLCSGCFSSHKVTLIKEAIEAVGARLVYLSPYSPDFSPIENCWSKVKEFLRSALLPLGEAQIAAALRYRKLLEHIKS